MVTTLPIDVTKTLHLEILVLRRNGTADFAPKQHQVTSRSRFSRLPKNSNKSNPSSKSMGQPSRPFPQKHSQRNFPLPPAFKKMLSNKSMGQMPAMVQEQHQPIQIVQRLKRHQDL